MKVGLVLMLLASSMSGLISIPASHWDTTCKQPQHFGAQASPSFVRTLKSRASLVSKLSKDG